MTALEVDVLIVGAGPSGASMACFLASYGVRGLIVSQAPSPITSPRSHYLSMAALECLRDVGVESKCIEASVPQHALPYHRIAATMAGQEYSRAFIFGNDPRRHGDYFSASPCEPLDLQQGDLEPILLSTAIHKGFKVRFDTKFRGLSSTGEAEKETQESLIEDMVTGQTITVRSKFLVAADGAYGSIMPKLEIPRKDLGPGGASLYVHVEADLSHLVDKCPATMHTLIFPEQDRASFPYFLAVVRPIKTTREWLFVFVPAPETTPSEDELIAQVKILIGDASIPVKLKSTDVWRVRLGYYEQYSFGNVFGLGDAVHQQPPHNGLGSNTGIQDAYNLAWKIAYVLKGQASRSLLSTYSTERQPVGEYVLKRATDTVKIHGSLLQALGALEPDTEMRVKQLAELQEDNEQGQKRRVALQEAVEAVDEERHALGSEMNQLYKSSGVFVDAAEGSTPSFTDYKHTTFNYLESTYPGSRLPHAWLRLPSPSGAREAMVSTQDVAGHGNFTLFTGIGGKNIWKSAVATVKKQLGLEIAIIAIGYGQDYEDVFFSWAAKREVEEKGAVLVRPDRTVAWRSMKFDEETSGPRLLVAMRSILGLSGADALPVRTQHPEGQSS